MVIEVKSRNEEKNEALLSSIVMFQNTRATPRGGPDALHD